MFINPFQNAFGLDIGDRSLKLIQLTRQRNFKTGPWRLSHASELDLPEGWIADGEILKPEEVVRALKKHLDKKQDGLSRSPWVAASLPETKTFLQLIKIKSGSGSGDITDADVREAAPAFLPYDIEDVYLDWQVFPSASSEKETTVLLGAVPKKIADPYVYLLNIAGLTPLVFEIEAVAIARAVINRQKDLSSQARGILDFGATRSSFIIFDRGCIQFSLSLPVSGIAITEKISSALNLDFAEAENMKKDCGLDPKKCQGPLKAALEEALNDLTDRLFQAIQFYKLHFPERNRLTGIRLTGGGSNMPFLENFLSAKLKMKVRKANPWVNLFSASNFPLPPDRAVCYTTAIGMAMRAIESPLV